MIQLSDVHKTFHVRDKKTRTRKRIEAVRGLSLKVEPGEIYGLLGPNGAGKSTTLRMIAGLMNPDQGSIHICGTDIQAQPERGRALVGYLSTDLGVYGRFTPREYLRIFGAIARALLHDPKAVIFDEPTTGLDVLTAKTVLDLLRIMKSEGRSVIVSTHVMPMVEEICDRVGIIFDGTLHGDAGPREILQRYGTHTLDEVFFQLAADSKGGA